MKKFTPVLALLFAFLSNSALAQVGQFYDNARVVNVQQVMQQIQQQDCNQPLQTQQYQPERSNVGGVLGGIAGALIGSQVGGGNGRIAAAAVGSVVGALSGDRIDNRNSQQNIQPASYSNTSSNCSTRYVSQFGGYLVTFEYNGRQGQKRLSYDPGQTVRVLVSVDPQ